MTHALGAVTLFLAANAPAAKKSSGSPFLLILVVIGAAFYFLIYRPQQKKQRAAQVQSKGYEVGDEVVTAGGIVGRVLDITDDRVTLETSVGASFTVLRPYVLRKLEPVEPPQDVVGEADDDHEPEPPALPPRPASVDEPSTDEPTASDKGTGKGKGTGTGTGAASGAEPPAGTGDEGGDGTDSSGADGPPII